MGRELQKKKNRSSISKIKKVARPKRANPLGNPIIAANWDKSQTLAQNYRRLGLTARLNAPTGGIEKHKVRGASSTTSDALAIHKSTAGIVAGEARVERDPETGKVLRVVHEEKPNPLNDLLLTDDEAEEERSKDVLDPAQEQNPFVKQLLEHAARAPTKKPRSQSEGEVQWLERLVERWGDDYAAMARDMKLNPMQQTAKDIKRRVEKMNKARK